MTASGLSGPPSLAANPASSGPYSEPWARCKPRKGLRSYLALEIRLLRSSSSTFLPTATEPYLWRVVNPVPPADLARPPVANRQDRAIRDRRICLFALQIGAAAVTRSAFTSRGLRLWLT